jgi:transcriptional regulator with XRE-family HTH domain
MKSRRPNRIAEIRRDRRLSQAELADLLAIHPITVSKLERGVMKLTSDWMSRFASALRIEAAELISDSPSARSVYVSGTIERDGQVSDIDDGETVAFKFDLGSPLEIDVRWYFVGVEAFFESFTQGDVLRFSEVRDLKEHVGRICLIETKPVGAFVGKILPSIEPGRFDLHRPGAPTLMAPVVERAFVLSLALYGPAALTDEDGYPLP